MSIYGRIVTGADVRHAVRSTIQLWIRDYLAEVARESGRASSDLPIYRSYATAVDLDKFSEDQTPACIIVAPGIAEEPQRSKQTYITRWGVGIGSVVSGQTRENSLELAELYTAAVRAIMIQQSSLGGFAEGVEWIGERYDELTGSEDLRTIGAGTAQLVVDVFDSMSVRGGPSKPTAPPNPIEEPGDQARVEHVIVTTKHKQGS